MEIKESKNYHINTKINDLTFNFSIPAISEIDAKNKLKDSLIKIISDLGNNENGKRNNGDTGGDTQ